MDGCCYMNCTGLPEYKCDCLEEPTYFCSEHIDIHIREEKDHKVAKNYLEISKGDAKMIGMQCSKCIEKFKKIKEKIILKSKEFINKILDQTVKYTTNNRELENLHLLVLEYLQINDKVVYRSHQTEIEKFILMNIENPNEIYAELIEREKEIVYEMDFDGKVKSLAEKNVILMKSLEEITNELNSLKESDNQLQIQNKELIRNINYIKKVVGDSSYMDLIDESFSTKLICYFDQNTKNLCKINASSNSDTRVAINIPDNLSVNAGLCQLPNNQFFYYGGNHSGYVDYSYIIDIGANTGVKKAGCKPKANIGCCCYYNDSIYAFAGQNNAGAWCVDSEKYSIASNAWQSIANFPVVMGYSTIITMTDQILVSGYNSSGVYAYNPTNNIYGTYINGHISAGHHRILCKGLGKVFLFYNSQLWDISTYTANTYKIINSSTGIPNNYLYSYVIRDEVNIFFMLNNKVIYKFNLFSKEVSQLRGATV